VCTPANPPEFEHIYHIYCISVAGSRDAILAELNQRGIGAGIHYPVPVHIQPAMTHRGGKPGDFPASEQAANSIISLPIYPELTHEQLDQVVEELSDVLGARGRIDSKLDGTEMPSQPHQA
jgi:dTDP-4-amino-4,6-dideoxygalactose transaminase